MSNLRRHFGTAGLLVAIVALVAALGGGAYAAENSGDGATASAKKKNRKGKQGGLNAKQKRQVRSISTAIAKRFQGTGPAGPQGVPGLPGAPGADGQNGSNGSNGKSVVLGTATAAQCPDGGKTVEVEGSGVKQPVCNGADGEDGEKGEKGDPWTAGGTLPEGATETGAWNTYLDQEIEGSAYGTTAISFPVPLASGLEPGQVKVLQIGEADESCNDGKGTAPGPGNPEADSGFLCVFVAKGTPALGSTTTLDGEGFGANTAGARLFLFLGSKGEEVAGTFAVTG